MKGARMSGRDLQRARKTAAQKVEDRLARQMARIAELWAALRDLRQTARVLLQNAEGCVRQHHGATDEPGWLRDCRLKIEAAEAVLKD